MGVEGLTLFWEKIETSSALTAHSMAKQEECGFKAMNSQEADNADILVERFELIMLSGGL